MSYHLVGQSGGGIDVKVLSVKQGEHWGLSFRFPPFTGNSPLVVVPVTGLSWFSIQSINQPLFSQLTFTLCKLSRTWIINLFIVAIQRKCGQDYKWLHYHWMGADLSRKNSVIRLQHFDVAIISLLMWACTRVRAYSSVRPHILWQDPYPKQWTLIIKWSAQIQ